MRGAMERGLRGDVCADRILSRRHPHPPSGRVLTLHAARIGGAADRPRTCVFSFFFQAEDGIRDVAVTGVQTCALPICLQIEFRQQQWHGMQFNASYTYSHSLSLESPPANGDSILVGMSTLRNLRLNYAPSYFDRRHVVHIFGTYDLPLGRGRPFLNHSGLLDRIVGGWTLGTIITYQTGLPFKVTGGYSTFNNIADGGVVLNGITVSQLQDAVGVYRTGRNFVSLINPKYLVSPTGGGVNPAFITPNTTPGTIGVIPWLHGPHTVTTNVSLTKNIPITERIRFSVQGEFLNAFNHPTFTTVVNTTMNVLSNNFGIGGGSNAFRAIQFRANLEF